MKWNFLIPLVLSISTYSATSFSAGTYFVDLSGPAESAGDYVISWRYEDDKGSRLPILQERYNGGKWLTVLDNAVAPGSKSFTNKPMGVYEYRGYIPQFEHCANDQEVKSCLMIGPLVSQDIHKVNIVAPSPIGDN